MVGARGIPRSFSQTFRNVANESRTRFLLASHYFAVTGRTCLPLTGLNAVLPEGYGQKTASSKGVRGNFLLNL